MVVYQVVGYYVTVTCMQITASRFHTDYDINMFAGCFNLYSPWVPLSFLLVAAVAIHRHPSLIILRSGYPSGGPRPTQTPQVDTSQASMESHNLIHNQCGCLCRLPVANKESLSPVSIQTQSLALRALRLHGNRAKRKRLR